MLSRHSVGIYQGNELTLNSSGNARPQRRLSSHSHVWTDPDPESGTGVRTDPHLKNK